MKNKINLKILLFISLFLILNLISACTSSPMNKSTKKSSLKSRENTVHPIEEKNVVLEKDTGSGYVNNIIVIVLNKDIDENTILSWFPNENPKIVGSFPALKQFQVRINPREKKELESLANSLMLKKEINFAHLNLAASTVAQSNNNLNRENQDPYFDPPTQNKPSNEWWYDAVGLKEAQKLLPTNNYIKVGVVDDGFDTTHKDLNLVFPNKEMESKNVPAVHGTHVAGIVQQIMPQAQITVADSYVSDDSTPNSTIATQLHFLKYLVTMIESDVKVLNYSMGSDISEDSHMPWNEEVSSIYSLYIWQLKQMGYDFILVQSAGNVGIDAYRNGMFATLNSENCLGNKETRESLGVADKIDKAQKTVFDSIVIVGSSDKKDSAGIYKLSEGTNYGDLVTLLAPGVGINSTVPGGYLVQGGTSQSAPIITGTLGAMWSINKNLTSGELKKILVESSTETAIDNSENINKRREYPLVNILEAIKMAKDYK